MTEKQLKQNIGITAALSTVMGTVIGGGVFFKTASVVSYTHSTSLTLIAWILGGLLTICGGLTVSELAAAIPKTGGTVQYLKYTYGPLTGFLLGWAEMIIYFPANMAALSIVFATQIANLFHLSSLMIIPIAFLCALSITLINLMGSKFAGSIQSITLIFKLIPIFIIAIAGLIIPGEVNVSFIPEVSGSNSNLITAFSGGLLSTMFAYDGWINIGSIAGEMKNPKKDLPKAIILGLSFIMIVYTLINFVFLKNLPLEQIAGNENTAFEVASILFGGLGGKLVTIGILISVYGAINGYTLTGIRVPYSLGKDDTLPFSKYFAKLSKKTSAPYVSGIFIFLVSIFMILAKGNFDILTNMLVFVMWIFNMLLFIALFILRKKEPELNRPYLVPWYPVIPIIALIGGAFILITTLFTQTALAITGIIATLVGIPVYYFHKHMKNK